MRRMVLGDIEQGERWEATQLRAAKKLLALALNNPTDEPSAMEPDNCKRETIVSVAVEYGLIRFDDLHHAPKCRANHWHRQRIPTGPCTCGAKP